MQAGDRVMVFDSPGSPLDHYLYSTVLQVNDAGAVVLIDHPGNLSHAQQRFVPAAKIQTAAEVRDLQAKAKQDLSTERDSEKIKMLREHVKHYEIVAENLT